jgi:phospholipid/cholesterol/gamma-HCH transport system substrate-binding protein
LALAAAVLVALVIVLSSGGSGHQLRAVFAAAIQVRPGQDVRVAGRNVGTVSSVQLLDGTAVVGMSIDDAGWPVHVGTAASLRFGAAAAYASRYVELRPGPVGAPTLPNDGLLSEADTTTPVEFDQIYSTFDAATRGHLAGTISGAAQTLSHHGTDLARDLELGGPGIQNTADMLGDLGIDPAALRTLVAAGASTFAALRSHDAQLEGVVSNAAQTFSVFADNASAMQASIERFPTTMTASQHSLAHLDHSLVGLNELIGDLAPGAAGLLHVAPQLTRTLLTIQRVGPLARTTLGIGAQQFPTIAQFLAASTPLLPHLSKTFSQLTPMVACVRPYAPEIGGYLGTWQGGAVDAAGHFGRIDIIQTPVAPGTSLTSAQAVAQSHGALQYAFPRPPGLNAGKPWFQSQCGAGANALNPADDPEAGK